MTSELAGVHLTVKGRVQGVGYRFFAEEFAQMLGLKGWVRNCLNGDVEAEVEGPRAAIEEWIEQLRKGPPIARVEDMQVSWLPYSRKYADFYIR